PKTLSYNPHPDVNDYPILSSLAQCNRLPAISRPTKQDFDLIARPTDYGKDGPSLYFSVRRWIRPEELDEMDEFSCIEPALDQERPIDVLIPVNLLNPSSGDRHLRVGLRRVDSPCSEWSSPARNSDYSLTAEFGCRRCRGHVSLHVLDEDKLS